MRGLWLHGLHHWLLIEAHGLAIWHARNVSTVWHGSDATKAVHYVGSIGWHRSDHLLLH